MDIKRWVSHNLGLVVFISLIIIAVVIIGALFHSYMKVGETEITIERMYIDNSGDSSYYMIATTDGRVFEADNCWYRGQNAIDKEWAYLQNNTTYTVHYVGWDIHNLLMDEYHSIYHFEAVQEGG